MENLRRNRWDYFLVSEKTDHEKSKSIPLSDKSSMAPQIQGSGVRGRGLVRRQRALEGAFDAEFVAVALDGLVQRFHLPVE